MEIWKAIKGYEGLYEVSNEGNVRSLDATVPYGQFHSRSRKGRIMHQPSSSNGYKQVALSKNGVAKIYRVHRLVAEAFLSNPLGLPEVNHKDEDKTNNRASNLEWCSRKYNNNYGNKPPRGSRNPMAKLTSDQVAAIRERRENGELLQAIADDYGISINHVCNIAKGKRWNY